MSAIIPIMPVGAGHALTPGGATAPAVPAHAGFGSILGKGLADVEARVAQADALVAAYARGDSIPVHQVTLALEKARVSVELAVQVRTRLLEAYRDLVNMQL